MVDGDVTMVDGLGVSKKNSITNSIDSCDSFQELPWVEKYRPKRLEDLVAQDDIVSILTNLIDSDNLPHLLLYGPPGTGKTSTIVAAAKRMYSRGGKNAVAAYNSMTLELNASDARGIDVVRNEIKEFAGTKQLFSSGIKLIILDEADAMTSDAQFALRRIIEKYTRNARFCLICNYVSKIIPALQSRCTRFRFAPLQPQHIRARLLEIASAERVTITPEGVDAILALSAGDMRRVLNLLQSTAMAASSSLPSKPASTTSTERGDKFEMIDMMDNTITTSPATIVDAKAVYLTAGAPLPCDIDTIFDLLLNETFANACERILQLCTIKGYAVVDVIQNLTIKVVSLFCSSLPELDSSTDNTKTFGNSKNYDNNATAVATSIFVATLLDGMSNVEHRLSFGTTEKIQIASLVGVFIEARHILAAKSTPK